MNTVTHGDDEDGSYTSSSITTGYVAGKTSTAALGAAGINYVPVADDPQNNDGRPAEIELLSDVEGLSARNKVDSSTEDKGDDALRGRGDAWMRDIWSPPNRAVLMSYFCVGFAMKFMTTPVGYYMVNHLGASPAQQNVFTTLTQLPWSFKLVYGFITDNFPIAGKRRKPYFVMGWGVFVTMNLTAALVGTPSVPVLCLTGFASTVGFMLSDVTTDAILVERSKHEPLHRRGTMQATGYITRFTGSLLGSIMGMLLFNKENWDWGLSVAAGFTLNAFFPIVFIGPWIALLRETSIVHEEGISVKERVRNQSLDVFKALQQRAVYVPMAFVFVYNIFQVPNAAWRSFLVVALGFKNLQLGVLMITASLMAGAGLLAYKRWFFRSSWRQIYIWTTLLVTFFSLTQLILIKRINVELGIPDLVFSIGDDSIADFVGSIQFLPVVRMYISMCPDGAEGTTYAILTTMANVSGTAAFGIGTILTKIWDVSNDAFGNGNYNGMVKLTILTSLIQPLPLIFIRAIPANQAELRTIQASGVKSWWGGFTLLAVLFLCLFWTVGQSLAELGG